MDLLSFSGCSVETALEAASLHPAQLLKIEDRKGTLDYDTDAGIGRHWESEFQTSHP